MARYLAVLCLLLVLGPLSASCGGGGGSAGSGTPIASAEELRGHDVGVASTNAASTLELRYVLSEKYSIGSSFRGGTDVLLVGSAADSIVDQLRSGQLRYAVLPPLAAFQARDDARVRVLLPISRDMRELTGVPAPQSVLASYADIVEQKPSVVAELNRILRESLTYLGASRDTVLDAVVEDTGSDRDYLDWWWQRFDLPLGQLDTAFQQGLLRYWEASVELGDIDAYPELTEVLFGASQGTATPPAAGVRQTLSLAVLDDPARRAALYAIEKGLVASDLVDLDVTYLPQSELTEAASTRRYDVVETPPTLIVQGRERGVDFVIVSAGLIDIDGTQLYVYD